MKRLIIICMCLVSTAVWGLYSSRLLAKDKLAVGDDRITLTIHKIQLGPDSCRLSGGVMGSSTVVYAKKPGQGFLWLKVTARNESAAAQDFDFRRIRLLFDRSVSQPYFTTWFETSFTGRAKDGMFVTLKPNRKATRELIYLYTRGARPYRLVYDRLEKNKVVGKLALDLPAEYITSD